jgi:hypothetical protein
MTEYDIERQNAMRERRLCCVAEAYHRMRWHLESMRARLPDPSRFVPGRYDDVVVSQRQEGNWSVSEVHIECHSFEEQLARAFASVVADEFASRWVVRRLPAYLDFLCGLAFSDDPEVAALACVVGGVA